MEIQVETITVQRLPKLSEGKYYTQSADVEIQNRVVSNDYIWLACNSTPDDWKIITQEEADEIIRLQEEFNKEHNIVPQTIVKEIKEVISNNQKVKENGKKQMTKKEINMLICDIEKEMREAAKKLDFERATELRDILFEIKNEI